MRVYLVGSSGGQAGGQGSSWVSSRSMILWRSPRTSRGKAGGQRAREHYTLLLVVTQDYHSLKHSNDYLSTYINNYQSNYNITYVSKWYTSWPKPKIKYQLSERICMRIIVLSDSLWYIHYDTFFLWHEACWNCTLSMTDKSFLPCV